MKNTDRRHGGAGGSQNLNVQPGRRRSTVQASTPTTCSSTMAMPAGTVAVGTPAAESVPASLSDLFIHLPIYLLKPRQR